MLPRQPDFLEDFLHSGLFCFRRLYPDPRLFFGSLDFFVSDFFKQLFNFSFRPWLLLPFFFWPFFFRRCFFGQWGDLLFLLLLFWRGFFFNSLGLLLFL